MITYKSLARRSLAAVAVSAFAFSALLSASSAMAVESDRSASELQEIDGALTTDQLVVLSESQTPEEAQQIAATAAPGNHIQVLWDENAEVIAAHPMELDASIQAISGRCEGNYARSFHLIGQKQQIFCYGGKGTWTGARGGYFQVQTTGLAVTVTFDTSVSLATGTCAANSTCNTGIGGSVLKKLVQ